jgi:hypothetical protein
MLKKPYFDKFSLIFIQNMLDNLMFKDMLFFKGNI